MLLKDIGSRRQFPNFTFARQKKLNEARARKVVSDILENAAEAALEEETVESFLREWLQQKENENTRERYKLVVDRFLSCMGKKSKSLISNISHRDILRFIKSRGHKLDGHAGSTDPDQQPSGVACGSLDARRM